MILLDILIGGLVAYLLSKILKRSMRTLFSVIVGMGGGLFAFALYPILNFDFYEPLGEVISAAIGSIMLLIVASRLRK